MNHNLQAMPADTGRAVLHNLRDVMARHGVLRLRARDGEIGFLELAQDGTARPSSLHLTWAHEDDLPRLRQAAALSEGAAQGTWRDEVTFYNDLLVALLRAQARGIKFGPAGLLAFVTDPRETDRMAFLGEGLVFTPR